jgi:ATP-dependent Clp protease ATP-binding subunit ClpA
MTVTLPIYIEEVPRGRGESPLFTARPLHAAEPLRKGEQLSRALTRLQSDLQSRLAELSGEPHHDKLAAWCMQPAEESTTLELRIELPSGSSQRRFFMAGYAALGRMLWFTPKLPDFHFEVMPGQRLEERAAECLTRHFRELEKRGDEVDLDDFALPTEGKGSLTALDVKFKLACHAVAAKASDRSSIFGGDDRKPDGERELHKVGRLLNSLYPDDLPRAIGRDTEVAELARWMSLPDRRAILLVGPRQVGKSSLVQEWVWRMMAEKGSTNRRKVWLVSPMRMISGMSYVGQWENRVQAICDHLEKSEGVLYLDDLPGLFSAGQSAGSTLNVAQLLKPRLESRGLRLLAEITPEAWRALRERDRAFADLFQVVPVAEPTEAEILRLLVGVAREAEREHGCEFALEAVPTVYELHRRFAGYAACGGAAAGFLRRLAVKHAGDSCDRTRVLAEFRERSGLQLPLLDNRQALDRGMIVKELRTLVAGQDPVLEAFADVLLKLKARLNDPRRPLGVLLLLGPTGVGKTQSAKALARHLFGSEDRLLRFDMNEMVNAWSARRLTGTAEQPDGLLTGAVRRQPFSVVLFDEIEKAAPEVFDMLLGVLDEGRLSDALGRVADFTSTVILLTSNLGVREAGTRLGFGSADAEESAESYVTAAERFFRPEFFNRLDRVLPFRELKRAHLTAITERLLADVLQRDGLRQRQCLFECGAAAKTRLVELGLQPQLGARALKRVIEREVAQPLAAELAVRAPGNPLFIEMDHDGTGFKLHTRELRPMARAVFWPEILSGGGVPPATVLDAAYEALDRLADAIESQAPDGVVDLHALTPEQARYYQCREQVKRVERLLQAAEASLRTRPQASSRALIVPRAKPVKIVVRQWISGSPRFDRERAAELLNSALADGESADADLIETPVFAVARELALLEMMVAEPYQDEAVGLAIWGQGTDAAGEALKIQQLLYGLLRGHWGVEFRKVEPAPNNSPAPWQAGVWGVGPNVARLLEPLAGCWLLHAPHGGVRVMQLRLQACASVAQLEVVLSGPAAAATDETVGVSVGADGSWLSHLTGLVLPRLVPADAFRAFHLSALPLPAELQSVFNS